MPMHLANTLQGLLTWSPCGVLDSNKQGGNMLKLGDLIMPGDDLDGATLCGNCQNHFKGDGDMDTCKECI